MIPARAHIGYVDGDKIVRVSQMRDAWPGVLGRQLLLHYSTEPRVRMLVAGGDINITTTQGVWYLHGLPGVTWEIVKPMVLSSQEGRACKYEWLYLWEDGRWMVSGDDGAFRPLADVLDEMDAAAAEVADAGAKGAGE